MLYLKVSLKSLKRERFIYQYIHRLTLWGSSKRMEWYTELFVIVTASILSFFIWDLVKDLIINKTRQAYFYLSRIINKYKQYFSSARLSGFITSLAGIILIFMGAYWSANLPTQYYNYFNYQPFGIKENCYGDGCLWVIPPHQSAIFYLPVKNNHLTTFKVDYASNENITLEYSCGTKNLLVLEDSSGQVKTATLFNDINVNQICTTYLGIVNRSNILSNIMNDFSDYFNKKKVGISITPDKQLFVKEITITQRFLRNTIKNFIIIMGVVYLIAGLIVLIRGIEFKFFKIQK